MSGATRFLLLLSSAPLPRLRLRLQRRSFLRFAHSRDLSAGASQLHWSQLVNNLSAAGYFQEIEEELGDSPHEFLQAANACLAFARHRPQLIAKLPRRDIEVLLENAQHTATRIRSFMSTEVLASDEAHMVDLMRFLLSYASNLIVPSEKNSPYNNELVEASVQNLFSELVKLSYSAPERQENQFLDGYGQIPKPMGETIEMKRGDWICPRCTFMNFARNVECRECQESRPKRQLTGGEWTCPQCDYYNHGKNSVCLRCDCKRPGHVSFGHTNSRSGLDYDKERHANNADVDRSRFAANEQKAQGWSNKVSQLDGTSNKSPTIVDEDFPDIMPLRKGVNRFVVSTRKTPLERRLADDQYRRNSGSDGSPDRNDLQSKSVNDKSVISGQRAGANSASIQYSPTEGSNYVPFVPLPADRFTKKIESPKMEGNEKAMKIESPKMEGNEKAMMDNDRIINANSTEQSGALPGIKDPDRSGDSIQLSEKPVNQTDSKASDQEGTEKSERWYKRISELHNVEDLATAIPDDDFPEVMPIRKGENRFVVSNKKDRSLTSPMYKRRMAMEQTNNNNYVPFVPLPADYFAKKDKPQMDGADTTDKGTSETPSLAMQKKVSERPDESRSTIINDDVDKVEKQPNTRSRDLVPSTENCTGTSSNPQTGISSSLSSGYQRKEDANEITNPSSTSTRPSENQISRGGSTGKSLEGSAVKKPDPLDMSEEAKAERWFRRVAQIKDISELSQIPDEDFPSIMPMRKGVNRFVVSKRKTPLERRLTSPQYRKNLPIVSSDPANKENEGS